MRPCQQPTTHHVSPGHALHGVHRDRQTGETEREREGGGREETDRQTDRQAEREREREKEGGVAKVHE